MPLLSPETLKKLIQTQMDNVGPISLLTIISDDPRGFGRILRKDDGSVQAIVEETVATSDQLKIKELNVGAYCFNANWLWKALDEVKVSPKGEFFLTDTISIAVQNGLNVKPVILSDLAEAIGVNTRIHLSEAESAMQERINRMHMLAGVTLIDPDTTFIETGISIGRDTVIWPGYLSAWKH